MTGVLIFLAVAAALAALLYQKQEVGVAYAFGTVSNADLARDGAWAAKVNGMEG